MLSDKLSHLTPTERRTVIAEMRNWVIDCQWADNDLDVEDMPEETLLYGIQRHFEGGIEEFISITID